MEIVGDIKPVYTIGHSNIPIENLIFLLEKNDIQILVDVRSVPYSKYFSQANKENLDNSLKTKGIKYLYMGELLGGRPKDIEIQDEYGEIDYSILKEQYNFKKGIERILKGAKDYKLCLLCSEEDPAKCHRGMLISKELFKIGIEIRHIRHNGQIETQDIIEDRIPAVQKHLF